MSETGRRVILWGIVLFVIFVCALLTYGATVPIVIRQPVSDGTTIKLQSGVIASQSFKANFPGLSRISVQVSQMQVGAEENLDFRLNASISEEKVTVLLKSQDVDIEYDQGWIHFRFPPQQAENIHHYVYYIENASSEEIVLLANSADIYPDGAMINEVGDMVFEAGFDPSASKTLNTMLHRLTIHKPGLAGAGLLYFLLLLSMTVAFTLFVGLLNRLQQTEPLNDEPNT